MTNQKNICSDSQDNQQHKVSKYVGIGIYSYIFISDVLTMISHIDIVPACISEWIYQMLYNN